MLRFAGVVSSAGHLNECLCRSAIERIPLFRVDLHIVQLVIIQDPVIDPFAGCPVFIGVFIFRCSPWDRGVKADVPVRLCINTAAVMGRGAGIPTGTEFFLFASNRTSPFTT